MNRAFVILLFVLTSAARSPAQSLTVGDEKLIPLASASSASFQAMPAVAFGQGIYLVAWREGWAGKGGTSHIYVARISRAGEILDSRGIAIAPEVKGQQDRPRVAFGGGVFLVAWQDFNGKDCDVLAARVSVKGQVLDDRPIAVAAGPRTQALPDVASDGRNFLVVWQGLVGEETSYRGLAAVVGADGKVGQAIETRATPQPKVAWNSVNYLAVCGGAGFWAGEVRAIVLDAEGRPRGKPTPVFGGTKPACFSVSAVPSKGWLVASHRSPPDPWGWNGPGAVRAAFINLEGKVDSPVPDDYPRDRLPNWLDMGGANSKTATWPWGVSASVWEGRHSVVVWQRHHLAGGKMTNFVNCDVMAARADNARSLDPDGVAVAASDAEETRPSLASDGAGQLLVVYEKHREDGGASNRVGFRMLGDEPTGK